MTMRGLMFVNALLAAVHGLCFLLLSSFALAFYGVTAGAGERLMGQLFGTELLVVALICWLGKGLRDAAASKAIAIAMCLPNAVGTVVVGMATVGGAMNLFGWLGTAIYGFLAVSYGWLLFAAPASAVLDN